MPDICLFWFLPESAICASVLPFTRLLLFFLNFKVFFSFNLFQRRGKRGREKGRGNLKQSMLSVELEAGVNLTTLRSGPEPRPRAWCSTDCASQSGQMTCLLKAGPPMESRLHLPQLCIFLLLEMLYTHLLIAAMIGKVNKEITEVKE